jgi:hypothetical protein
VERALTIDFANIAPYLKDPLILVGFFLFLGFLFVRGILKAGIIPQLSLTFGYRVLQRILLYGFVIALALISVGFFLKYRELSEREQAAAVRMLDQELAGNIRLLAELKSNIETILNATSTVSTVLRTPSIKLLAALFPSENLDPKKTVPASAEYAAQVLANARDSGLIEDELERRKFGAAAQAISGTIQRTTSTIRSLADPDGKRYVLKSEIWASQLPILRKVDIVNVTRFQATYTELELARANYNVVVGRCVDYLAAVGVFLAPPDHEITRQNLAAVLASERLYIDLTTTYATKLIQNIKDTDELDKIIRQRISEL